MTKSGLNPDSITLENVQSMPPREFRQWNFLELKAIHKEIKGCTEKNKETREAVKGLDNRMWAALIGIVIMVLMVLGEAFL